MLSWFLQLLFFNCRGGKTYLLKTFLVRLAKEISLVSCFSFHFSKFGFFFVRFAPRHLC